MESSSSPPLASYPVEENDFMGSMSSKVQLQKASGQEEKWKRHSGDLVDVTPQTKASTPNTTSSLLAVQSHDGSSDTIIQHHHHQQQQQHAYWTPPQEERCSSYRQHTADDSFHPAPDFTTPTALAQQQDIAMDLHGMSTNNRPIIETSTCTTPPSCDYSNTAVVHATAVMRDSTNTSSSEVESRALFPESSSDEEVEQVELTRRYSSPEQSNYPQYGTALEPPHKQWGGMVAHELKEQVAFTTFASPTAVVTNNDPHSRKMKSSRRKVSTSSSPNHRHVLVDSALTHQHQQHHSVAHPLLDHHQRNPSVDSSLSTLSSLGDGTFDGSVQTSPHPYRPSSVLVVSSRNSVLRRSTLLTTATFANDSHSLPPPPPSQKYHDKSNNNSNSNSNNINHDLKTSSAFGEADGGGTRGVVRTAAKSLLRLAATTRGLLWIMCFMAMSSVSMTVLTSRMLDKSHEELSNRMHMENKPGTSGSVLFPPGKHKHRVLIPVKNQQHESMATTASKPNAPAARPTAVKSKENKSTSPIQNRKVRRKTKDRAEINKRDKPKQQRQEQPEKKVTVKPQQVAIKPLSPGKDKTIIKGKTKQHNQQVDTKSKTVKSTFSSKLKPVKQPKGTIGDKRRETVDHKLYRIKASSTKGQALGQLSRVVYFHESLLHQKPKHRKIVQYPADFTDCTQLYSVLDSSDERVSKSMELRQPYVQGECVPMKEWQTTFHPSCNAIHALGLDRLGETDGDRFDLFGTKGFWRNAWKVDVKSGQNRSNDDGDVVVLKTLKIQHKFEEAHFEHDRIDAVAMERLTSSPHVIDVFGFCGHSVLSEYANGKRLGALADKSRSTPLARLRIARDIATGLADVHGIDGDGNATFVHLDVNPANVVSVGGTLKLNDFNIGIIRRWNTTSNEPCGFPAQYPNPQWRSPEEARNEMNLTEKVDVFSMGHIFFRLICGHEPWNKLEPGGKPSKAEMTEKVTKGALPTIPSSVLQSTDKEVVAIREAMLQCYKFNPKDRPSAREIANALQRALDDLGKKVAAV